MSEPDRPLRLLFVCTGNICRSPMAQVLSVRTAAECGVEVEARSAGVLDLGGREAERHAVAVVAELGLSLVEHRSQVITEELVGWADWVLVMELAHAVRVRELWQGDPERVVGLGPFVGITEIPDPMGGWRRRFRVTRDQLRDALDVFFDRVVLRGTP